MKVALVHDDLARLVSRPDDPLDIGSEWEDERTVAGQAEALRAAGHEVTRISHGPDLIAKLEAFRPDCVFNIAEGRRGKDRESIVPAVCRQMGFACTSSDAAAMALTLDKGLSKALARSLGIPTPDGIVVRRPGDLEGPLPSPPLFVKPNGEGSSMGIRPESVARTLEDAREAARRLLDAIGPVLLETFLPGPEYTVGLLGNEDPEAFPVAEIRTGGRVYDKSMKSKDRMEEEIVCPADLDPETATRLVDWSRTLWREMGLAGMARFDFKCDRNGRPAFLEANPLPGMSRFYSVYILQAATHGIGYERLLARIVDLAVRRAETEFSW